MACKNVCISCFDFDYKHSPSHSAPTVTGRYMLRLVPRTSCLSGFIPLRFSFSFSRLGLMSHFGALAAASSRYAALCGSPADPRNLPWYWGRLQPQLPQDRPSPTGKLSQKIHPLSRRCRVNFYVMRLKQHESGFPKPLICTWFESDRRKPHKCPTTLTRNENRWKQ